MSYFQTREIITRDKIYRDHINKFTNLKSGCIEYRQHCFPPVSHRIPERQIQQDRIYFDFETFFKIILPLSLIIIGGGGVLLTI